MRTLVADKQQLDVFNIPNASDIKSWAKQLFSSVREEWDK